MLSTVFVKSNINNGQSVEMKKILFAVENYYPNLSGVPVVVEYLAEGLEEKYEVHVVTRRLGSLKSYEEYKGISIHRFDIKNNALKRAVGDIKGYVDFVVNGGFDVIILECTQCVTTDVLLPYLDRIKAKKILHSHGFSGLVLKPFRIMGTLRNTVGNTLNYFVWKNYYRNVLPGYLDKIDSFLCLSDVDCDYDYLMKKGIKVEILPNAAEDQFFPSGHECSLKKYIPSLKEKYAISVANYSDIKNQMGILKEFNKAGSSEFMDLVFIGTKRNDYYDKLETLARELKKKNGNLSVYLLHGVERKDIPGAVENASLYLCGSKWEAYSISLIESMALSTPFISTNVGNARALPGGVVVEDISKMSSTLDSLMKDEKKRQELSQRGRRFASANCRIEKAVEGLTGIIEES